MYVCSVFLFTDILQIFILEPLHLEMMHPLLPTGNRKNICSIFFLAIPVFWITG